MGVKHLWIILILLIPLAAAQELYYNLELFYDDGGISLVSLKVKPLLKGSPNYGENRVEIIDFEGSVLDESLYMIPLLIYGDIFDDEGKSIGGSRIVLNQTEFEVSLPYFKNAKEINFYDENKNLLLSVDVKRYSQSIDAETLLEEKPEEKVEEAEKSSPVRKKIIETKPTIKAAFGAAFGVALIVLLTLVIMSARKKRPVQKEEPPS